MKTDPSPIPKTASLPIDVYGDPLKIKRIFNQFIMVIIAGLCIGIVYDLYKDGLHAAVILGVCILPLRMNSPKNPVGRKQPGRWVKK